MQVRTPLLAIVFVFGFLTLAPSPAAAQDTYDVKGQVCSHDHDIYYIQAPEHDDCLGGPLAGATVQITSSDGLGILPAGTAETDEDGMFYFDGLAEGDYQLHAEREGFEPQDRDVTVPSERRLALNLDGLQLTVTGTVDSVDGPVEGATATFYHRQTVEARTDGDGDYETTLTAGYHEIQLTHSDYRASSEYRLIDGTEAMQHKMTAAPVRDASVRGVVVDQDGEPVAGAQLDIYQWDCCYEEPRPMPADSASGEQGASEPDRAYPEPYGGYQSARTDAEGAFSFDVFSGWLDLAIWKDGYARINDGFEVRGGETERDYTMQKFPEKTARITGQVTDTDGDGLQWASISIENPQYGTWACSNAADQSPEASSEPGYGGDVAVYPYEPQCDISVDANGRFEGTVMPGYSILHVRYDHYRSCHETRHADGAMTRACGPQYFSHAQTLVLPEDSDTTLPIVLAPRPSPDATLSGYAVDTTSGEAVAGVQVQFSNEATYGWASAQTDDDGSYKVRLHNGHVQVSVWADGYYPWQGVVTIPPGGAVELDIPLTRGQSSYGHCCYAYAEGDATDAAPRQAEPTSLPTASPQTGQGASQSEGSASSDAGFENLGGGLGPYNADARGEPGTAEVDTPGVGVLLSALALLGAALLLRRQI